MLKRRTFTGCWACRFKKRRCDEERPKCALCLKHGDSCSYDVKLIWLGVNMYQLRNNRLINLRDTYKRISKEQFKKSTKVRYLNNFGQYNNLENEGDSESFTVSLRRSKVYNNALPCIHGDEKNHDSKFVDQQLNYYLKQLKSEYVHLDSPFHVLSFDERADNSYDPMILKLLFPVFNVEEDDILRVFFSEYWKNLLKNHTGSFIRDKNYTMLILDFIKDKFHDFSLLRFLLLDIKSNSVDMGYWLNEINSIQLGYRGIFYFLLSLFSKSSEFYEKIAWWFLERNSINIIDYSLIEIILHQIPTSADFLVHCITLIDNVTDELPLQIEQLILQLKIRVCTNLVHYWDQKFIDGRTIHCGSDHSELQVKYWTRKFTCYKQLFNDIYV